MDFWLLPPEINSLRIYTGPGSAPMLEASAAWTSVSGTLYDTAADAATVVAGIPWSGPSSEAMRAAWERHQSWLLTTAAHAAHTAATAQLHAGAYETARAASVPPPLVAANRAQTAALIATNFLGINTPAIAALEAQYMEMWAQDVAAMGAYLQATQTAMLQPFTAPDALGNYLLGGHTVPQMLWNVVESNISSGPWQAVMQVLGLFTTFWGVTAATGPDSPLGALARITNQIETPPAPAATPLPKTTPITASTGTATRAGGLSVPRTCWAATAPFAPGRESTVRSIPPSEEIPLAMPLPIGAVTKGTPTKQQRPEPEYGATVRFVSRPPAGG